MNVDLQHLNAIMIMENIMGYHGDISFWIQPTCRREFQFPEIQPPIIGDGYE
jgi:hypothetical protein